MKILRIFTGAMAGSKSTQALHTARRYLRLNKKVALIRPRKSLRSHESPGKLVTKNGETFPATEVDSATEIPNYCIDADVVWIDEPALFEDEEVLAKVLTELRATKVILISGISATSELEPFGKSIPLLLAVADEIVQLKSDCDSCALMNSATRHILCKGNKSGQILVGGESEYSAVCPECWTRLIKFPVAERRNNFGDRVHI